MLCITFLPVFFLELLLFQNFTEGKMGGKVDLLVGLKLKKMLGSSLTSVSSVEVSMVSATVKSVSVDDEVGYQKATPVTESSLSAGALHSFLQRDQKRWRHLCSHATRCTDKRGGKDTLVDVSLLSV